MRNRSLPLILGVIVVLGLILSLLVLKRNSSAPESTSPQPVASATEQPSGTPVALPSGAATPPASLKPSNPNPDLTVDANGLSKATVIISTDKGPIRFKFYPTDAPNTVKRMIQLINSGFYNGLTFHRVEPGFVIQGGDPLGNGTGGSGQKLKAEFNNRKHLEGTVAMARASDPDSADSQFYITLSQTPHLDHSYTVFGQVIEGMDVVRKIQVGDKMTSVIIE